MISYILSFRALVLSLLVIVIIEGIFFLIPKPEFLIKSNMIDSNYMTKTIWEKTIIDIKRQNFYGKDFELIQVGDSAGFYGVQPKIVMQYLPNLKFMNASCCAGTGWSGYKYIAEDYLKSNKVAKYLVLYISLYSLPMYKGEGFGEEYKKYYISPLKLVEKLPSADFRFPITNFLFYREWNFLPHGFEGLIDTKKLLERNYGWAPINQQSKDIPTHNCSAHMLEGFYDKNNTPTLYRYLVPIKKLADQYKVKLVVLFNPIACKNFEAIEPINVELNKFATEHKDVIIPQPSIVTYEIDEFSDKWHLNEKGSIRNSHRVGKLLEKALFDK